jgi:hypothetical protein
MLPSISRLRRRRRLDSRTQELTGQKRVTASRHSTKPNSGGWLNRTQSRPATGASGSCTVQIAPRRRQRHCWTTRAPAGKSLRRQCDGRERQRRGDIGLSKSMCKELEGRPHLPLQSDWNYLVPHAPASVGCRQKRESSHHTTGFKPLFVERDRQEPIAPPASRAVPEYAKSAD